MTIRYSTTRGDLLGSQFRALFHNRIIMGFWVLLIAWTCFTTLSGPTLVEYGIAFQIIFTLMLALFLFVVLTGFTFVLTSLIVLARKNRGVLGDHTLTITDEGLLEKTDYNESLNKWIGFHRVVSTKNYLMIYVTEGTYHVVSKKRPLLEGDLDAFEKLLREKNKKI